MKKNGLLDVIAKQRRTYISNLRLQPELKWAALGDVYKRQVPVPKVSTSTITGSAFPMA